MGEFLTCHQHGRTLSYICERSGSEDSGSPRLRTHRIIVERKGWSVLEYFSLLFVFLCFLTVIIMGRGVEILLHPLPIFGALFLYWARRERVVQEAVVVMPTFGIQLETVYHSKKVHRRFVPLRKILAPVINEAVTPGTCYFYLALLLRDEEDLLLTFLDLRPPLKMLIPIWRSLSEVVVYSMAKPLSASQASSSNG